MNYYTLCYTLVDIGIWMGMDDLTDFPRFPYFPGNYQAQSNGNTALDSQNSYGKNGGK